MSENDLDDIDKLYEQALAAEIGDSRQGTDKVRTAIYDGELGFALQVHCIKPDTPPIPSTNIYTKSQPDEYVSYYKFTMTGLNHDMAMFILTNLKDVFPVTVCTDNMSSRSYGSRRNAARKELEALGIAHMGQWITCCKDGTYTITIRHLQYKDCGNICKVLFSW